MTTCVVVRKEGQVAIAAESLVTFGDTRLPYAFEENRKIFQVGESFVTLAGTAAHFPVMRKLLLSMGDECRLHDRDAVFDTFSRVHALLKEHYFLNTREEEDDPYESSQLTVLIANQYGIFGVYSYREVFCFDRFWSIGSGRSFALGAMQALYDLDGMDAEAIAQAGVEAGIAFDKNSDGPTVSYQIELATDPFSAEAESDAVDDVPPGSADLADPADSDPVTASPVVQPSSPSSAAPDAWGRVEPGSNGYHGL